MQVIAKLFGAAREAAGAKELSLALSDGATARDVWGLLLDENPAIAPFADRLAVAVNLEIRSLQVIAFHGRLTVRDGHAFSMPQPGSRFQNAGFTTLNGGTVQVDYWDQIATLVVDGATRHSGSDSTFPVG